VSIASAELFFIGVEAFGHDVGNRGAVGRRGVRDGRHGECQEEEGEGSEGFFHGERRTNHSLAPGASQKFPAMPVDAVKAEGPLHRCHLWVLASGPRWLLLVTAGMIEKPPTAKGAAALRGPLKPTAAGRPAAAAESVLRPPSFEDFTGQAKTIERLRVMVGAAKARGEASTTFCSPGRRASARRRLAFILGHGNGPQGARHLWPGHEKAGDLAGLLTNLAEGDILFIDEIHRLSKTVEEYLYSAMRIPQLTF